MSCAVVAIALLTAGCRAGYVARVGFEHLRYVRSASPIERVLAATEDSQRRERLELVLEARSWAARNGLDVGGSYASVADTTGLATAYVVTAAYPDRLEPYEWNYPIVGRIPYRGYFERESAERYAAKLAAEGFDTYIVEASGYSTLGWFDDPLPSGVLDKDRVEIVAFLFHELLHQTLYVPGQIAFNETLATAVSDRLTAEFFAGRNDQAALAVLAERSQRWLEQAAFCDDLAERLTALFDGATGAVDAKTRAALYDAAVPDLQRLKLIAVKPGAEQQSQLNNAWFLAVWRYRRGAQRLVDWLAGFETLAAALQELEARLEFADDPYDVLSAAGS